MAARHWPLARAMGGEIEGRNSGDCGERKRGERSAGRIWWRGRVAIQQPRFQHQTIMCRAREDFGVGY